jgi:hypothetical protein
MANSTEWCVAVFKCSPGSLKKVLVEVYQFADGLKGVRSLHFLITDRVGDEVVLSFRILVEPKFKEIVKTNLSRKLSSLISEDKYAIDPAEGNNLKRYAASLPEKRPEEGQNKFNNFLDVLKKLSDIVIEMIENDYFASNERVDLTHFITWMLGCTECGLLSPSGMQVGYYDRLDDKYLPYLKYDFPKSKDQK